MTALRESRPKSARLALALAAMLSTAPALEAAAASCGETKATDIVIAHRYKGKPLRDDMLLVKTSTSKQAAPEGTIVESHTVVPPYCDPAVTIHFFWKPVPEKGGASGSGQSD